MSETNDATWARWRDQHRRLGMTDEQRAMMDGTAIMFGADAAMVARLRAVALMSQQLADETSDDGDPNNVWYWLREMRTALAALQPGDMGEE